MAQAGTQGPGLASQIRSAWWSFYFNLYGLDPMRVRRELRPTMSKDQAQKFLVGVHDAHQAARSVQIRLALDTIPNGEVATIGRAAPPSRGGPKQPPSGGGRRQPPSGGGSGLPPRIRYLAPKTYMMAGGGNQPACTVRNATSVAQKDQGNLSTTVTATLEINRPIAALQSVIDPRHWDTCSDVFLEASPAIRLGVGNYAPQPDTPPPLGTAWAGFLYERVSADGAEFDNVLSINFAPAANQIDLKYTLKNSLGSSVVGVKTSAGLAIDSGTVTVTPSDAGWSKIVAIKTVLFDDFTPNIPGDQYGDSFNYAAPATLSMWLNDMNVMGPCC